MNADSMPTRQTGRLLAGRLRVVAISALCLVALAIAVEPGSAGALAGAKDVNSAPVNDGAAYPVSRFAVSYGREQAGQPAAEQFLRIPIALGKTAKGYVAPRQGVDSVTIRLADFQGGQPQMFHASAIRRINQSIVAAYNRVGLVGIYVAPNKEDLDARTGQDLRQDGDTTFRLVVWSVAAADVSTLGPPGAAGADAPDKGVAKTQPAATAPVPAAPAPAAKEEVKATPATAAAPSPAPALAPVVTPAKAEVNPPAAPAAEIKPAPALAPVVAPAKAEVKPAPAPATAAAVEVKPGPATAPIGTTAPSPVVPALPGLAASQPGKAAPIEDGDAFTVSKFQILYGREHKSQPPVDQFMNVPIVLGKTAKGYVMPRPGIEQVTVRLSDFKGDKPQVFYASALRRIDERIVAAYNRLGLAGIFVAPHKDDVDSQNGKDLRKATDQAMRLVVWSATVAGVRTLAAGDRVPTEARIDNPVHQGILDQSPLNSNDLLDKSLLDDYVFFLNRHPGRQVDLAVTSGEKPGQVNLDYMVSENRPWLAYAQASNTGTRATAPWRFRFGVIDNQVTNNDDILTAEYTTSCTEPDPAAQTASVSYEAPVFKNSHLRWRAYSSWGKFDANIAGVGTGENWDGWEWTGGAELAYNFFQHKQTFLDLVGGAEIRQVFVDNRTLHQDGLADFFVPHLGLRVESITDTATTVGSIFIEHNCSGMAGSSREDYDELGRQNVSADYELVRWDVLQTFYLEPLINGEAWMDTAGKDAWKNTTLANELAFQFRGQWTPGEYRMVPQNEAVAGGFFTVRGYPESVIAGDTALIATGEYRLHVPRLFKPQETPGRLPLVGTPFRWSPQAIYGRPDWDLICRAFCDMAKTINSRPETFEPDQSIWSMGLGVELQFTRNFNVRADLGFPMKDLKTNEADVQAGDPRLHFVATIVY
jgi:hypothetical protein